MVNLGLIWGVITAGWPGGGVPHPVGPMADPGRTVICDTGTSVIKAGFASESEPSLTVPTLLGRPMLRYDQGLSQAHRVRDLMIGEDANAARSMLQLSRPVQNGVIQDWDAMEAVWDYTFAKMGVATPSEHKVVQTEAALNPRKNREKMAELMFEKFGFSAVNISVQAILSLLSAGLDTGLVVDSGDGVTHIVPVWGGYLEPALVQRVNLAGRHVTEHLMKLLVGQGHPLNSTADFETVREVKQRLCYVALDPDAERRLAQETTLVDRQYTLPDSRTMRVGAERFLAPEILFNPGLHGRSDGEGLAGMVFNTVRKSDLDVQKDYFGKILLSGGSTMFPGMSSRLEKDIRQLYLERVLAGDKSREAKFRCFVEDPPDRQSMVFRGAALQSRLFEDGSPFWVHRSEYQEHGASIVERLIPTRLS